MKPFATRNAVPLAAAGIFLAAFAWLLFCLAPTVYWGDSAELTAASRVLGVAHAPGYPLYVTLAHLLSAVPAAGIAFRANLASALLAAIALVVFGGAALRLTRSLAAAGFAVLLIVTLPTFLRAGLYAEVYALHLLLFALVLLLALRPDDDRRGAYVAWLLLGFGAAHHALIIFPLAGWLLLLVAGRDRSHRAAALTAATLFLAGAALIFRGHAEEAHRAQLLLYASAAAALVAAAYWAFLVWKRHARPAVAHTALAAAAFLIGTFPWLQLPLTAARRPFVNWWDPQTPTALFSLVSLRGYISSLPHTRAEWFDRVRVTQITSEMILIFFIIGVIGILLLLWKDRRAGIPLAVTAAGSWLGALLLQHGKPESLRLPLFVAAAVGIAWLAAYVAKWQPFRRGIPGRVVAAALVLFAAYLFAAQAEKSDVRFMSRSTGAHELGASILKSVPDRAILFLGLQTPGIMDYFAVCEPDLIVKRRIAVIPASFLSFDWKVEQIAAAYPWIRIPLIEWPKDQQNIFRATSAFHIRFADMLIRLNSLEGNAWSDFLLFPMESGRMQIPQGPVYRIADARFSAGQIRRLLSEDRLPTWSAGTTLDPLAATNLASVHNERGAVYLNYAYLYRNPEFVDTARKDFDAALAIQPDSPAGLSGRGQCFAFLGDFARAIKLQRRALTLDPSNPAIRDALATTYFREQSPDSIQQALALWTSAAAFDTTNPKYYHNMAAAFVALKQAAPAIAAYRKAIAVDPDYVPAYIGISRVYRALHNCPEMIENLERVRDRIPDNVDIHTELASAYSDCGLLRLFHSEIDIISRNLPHDAEYYHIVGVLLRDAGDVDGAVRAYRAAKALNASYSPSDLFAGMEDCREAAPILERAAALIPDSPDLRMLLAQQTHDCGDNAKTLAVLLKAQKDFPTNTGIKTLLAELNAKKPTQ